MMPAADPERPSDPPPGAVAGPVASASRRRERTCVGCRTAVEPATLVRIVLGPDGEVAPDLARRTDGRGAWVHSRPECVREAARRGLARSFKSPVKTSPAELSEMLRGAAERRIAGLVSAAWRARHLEVGSDPVVQALGDHRARLVIVARDARAAAETPAVQAAIAAGRVKVWATKAEIGRATGRAEVGVVAVTDDGLAQALSIALELAQMRAPAAEPTQAPPGGPTEDG